MTNTPALAPDPRAGRPGPTQLAVANQTTFWIDRFDAEHQLTEMPTDYVLNVLGYLRWYADDLFDEAYGPSDKPADPAEIRAFLLGLPLWSALADELAVRDVIADRSLAIAELERGGAVPWELPQNRPSPAG